MLECQLTVSLLDFLLPWRMFLLVSELTLFSRSLLLNMWYSFVGSS